MISSALDIAPESLGRQRDKDVPRLLPLIFFALSLLFLLTSASAFGAAYLRSRDLPDGYAWKPPMEQVAYRELVPSYALLPLLDLSAQGALNRTLEGTDLNSALALVAFDPRLSDPSRVGALLQIGSRFAEAREHHQAAWSFQSAATLAVLSPALSDAARVETLITAASGLRMVDAKEAGHRVLDQAYLIAIHSPSLRRQQRIALLNQIASAYEFLGMFGIAEQARSKSQDVTNAAEGPATSVRAPFIPVPGKLPPSPVLDRAIQLRVHAALQLQDDISATRPKSLNDWPRDSLEQLRKALRAEDRAREEHFARQFFLPKEPAVQTALLLDRAGWLALKYRTARGGFVANLVPEWSENTARIGDELSDTFTDLFALYHSQAGSLLSLQDTHQATEDVLRQQLIAVRWGWSQRLESDLKWALAEAAIKLRHVSAPTLRVDWATRNGRTLYLLLPDELHGQGARGFPR